MTVRLRDLGITGREIILALALLMPVVALVGLGGLWLWENGFLAVFAAASVGGAAFAVVVRALPRKKTPPRLLDPAPASASQAEKTARDALRGLQEHASAADLATPSAAQALLRRTIETVAQAYHPGDSAALYNVTVPELLLMTEDTARRLRDALVADVPVLRHLDLSLVVKGMALSRPARALYQGYRLLRFLSPVTAVVQEMRGVLVDKAFDTLTDAVKARIAAVIVGEVGETAIKLYAGGYHTSGTEAQASASLPGSLPARSSLAPPSPPAPLVVLLAGQANAGKSSLLNALAGAVRVPAGLTLPTDAFVAIDVAHPTLGAVVFVDSPGLSAEPSPKWLDKARDADLILWVAAAHRADRAVDQKALRALRRVALDDVRQRETPMILVATHADRLPPPRDWTPPYDVATGERPKERALRAALTALGESLALPAARRVVVSVEHPGPEAWNVDAVWACLEALEPEGRQKQRERGLRREGWVKVALDFGRSLPGMVEKAGKFIIR